MGPQRPNGPRKKTELEKRLRDERDEKRNWLLLAPGQLTGKYERREGYRPLKEEVLEAEEDDDSDRPRDYTFYGLGQPKHLQSQNDPADPAARKARAAVAARSTQSAASASDSMERKKSPAKPGTRVDEQGRPLGVHTASELDLKGYLDPTQFNPGAESSDNPLRSLLGAGQAPVRTREQQARLEDYRSFLENPSAARATTPPEGLRLPSELSKPPAVPAPRLPETALRSGGGNPFAPTPGIESPSMSRGPLAPSLSDWNTPRAAAPARNLPPPPVHGQIGQPPPARPSVLRPTVLEIPQRQW